MNASELLNYTKNPNGRTPKKKNPNTPLRDEEDVCKANVNIGPGERETSG